MEIDIRNFLNASVGYKENYDIDESYETELTEEAILVSTKGKVELMNLDDGILARFNLHIRNRLTCVRCLGRFTKEQNLKFDREYSFKEEEDKIKISKDLKINILEPIREEAILNIPMKVVCKEKCKGLNNEQ